MNIFIDVEYTKTTSPQQIISLGMHSANGRDLYIEFSGILVYDLSHEAESILSNLINPSVELNSIVCRDADNKECHNIRNSKTTLLFKAGFKPAKEYILTWLESFDEYIDFITFDSAQQSVLLYALLSDHTTLPSFISPFMLDIATMLHMKGYRPEEIDLEDFSDFKVVRHTSINVAKLNEAVYNKLTGGN